MNIKALLRYPIEADNRRLIAAAVLLQVVFIAAPALVSIKYSVLLLSLALQLFIGVLLFALAMQLWRAVELWRAVDLNGACLGQCRSKQSYR